MSQEVLTGPDEIRRLLEDVRRNAVQLVAEVGRTPRNLRVRAGGIALEIEWDEGGHAPAPVVTVEPADDAEYLTAPAVGVFYHAPQPGAEPFVADGDVVEIGQQVGIVEAMKLMIPVQADRAGRITEVLKADGQPVEYGERLFAIVGD
ncbi:MAG: biotin/lipoyl-containing protein [Kibdelosporangium sp.]